MEATEIDDSCVGTIKGPPDLSTNPERILRESDLPTYDKLRLAQILTLSGCFNNEKYGRGATQPFQNVNQYFNVLNISVSK